MHHTSLGANASRNVVGRGGTTDRRRRFTTRPARSKMSPIVLTAGSSQCRRDSNTCFNFLGPRDGRRFFSSIRSETTVGAVSDAWDVVKYAAGFTVGILEGAWGALEDLFRGAVDLGSNPATTRAAIFRATSSVT